MAAPSLTKTAAQRWALITGASSGIGRALAWEFAQRGFSLVLIARNEAQLQHLSNEINKAHVVKTRVLSYDLTQEGAARKIFERLRQEDIFVEVLVNNAGFGLHGLFAATDGLREIEMVKLHVINFLEMTKLFLPEMIKMRNGKILNVASVYSFVAVPNQAVYSATKSFMLAFSEALRSEIRGSEITLTVLVPGITRTEFRTRMGICETAIARGMAPEKVARFGCEALMKGKFIAIPGLGNRLFVLLSQITPRAFISWLIRKINQRRGFNR